METAKEAATPPPERIEFLKRAADTQWVERLAKLFEVGEYPDKGVTVSGQDLVRLCEGFDVPVPVLIEHAESPLELGYLTSVEVRGDELFGRVALTHEANALVERSNARSLSLGLTPDLGAIREVSLVRNPRVASARLYSNGPRFVTEFSIDPPKEREADEWQRRYRQLQGEQSEMEADRKVASFVAEGRLTPAQAPIAKAILLSEGAIEFDGQSRSAGQLLVSMIERQAPHGMFGERAFRANSDYSSHLMLPEEVAFYRRHFPDVSLDEIAKKRGRS